MPDFGSSLWNKPASGGGGGDSTPADPVTRSLRFDPDSNSYLQRATGSTDTTWTMAMWVKRSGLTGYQYLFNFGSSKGLAFYTGTNSLYYYNGSTNTSTEVFRDPSAWFHITMVTTSGTATFYVNGVQVTSNSFSTPRTSSALGTVTFGRWTNGAYDFDGYLASIHFIEGEAKSPTDFIELNDYGNYIPKAYTGSFGTNGFHLDAQPSNSADLLVSSVARNDGDTTFADAAQGHGLTVSGDTEHSIAVGNPFTGDDRAMYFDGSSALTMPDSTDWEPSGDFTYEAWIMPTWSSAPTYSFPFGHGSSGGTDVNMGHGVLIKNGTLYLTGWFGSTYHHPNYSSSGSGFAVSANEWTHVAVVRDGNTIRYYKNGVQESTFTVSGSATAESNVFALGRSGGLTSYAYTGYIADFRITHDAEYPSGTTFTTPTAPHSTTSDTKVRIQPQLSDTTWDDEENNHTISTVGSPTRTASTPYDAAAKSTAIYIPASSNYSDSNYLETSVSTDFRVGTGAYTLEGWIYIPTNYTGNFTPFGHYGADITMHGKTIACYGGTLGNQASSTSVDIGEWKHVAVVRESTSSNGAALYYDGNRIHQFTNSVNLNASVEVALSGQNGSFWNQTAYYYDLRLTKGTARYTGSTYDTPTAPFELNPVYIGGDQSGNKNHFTPTNISSHDVMLDTPTKNYATMSPVSRTINSSSSSVTFGEGNLSVNSSGTHNNTASTIAMPNGKWYAEIRPASRNNAMVGVCRATDIVTSSQAAGYGGSGHVVYIYNGSVYNGSATRTSYAFSSADGDDVVQLAVDVDNSKIWFGLNDTWEGTVGSSGGHSLDSGEQVFVYTYRNEVIWNFGQDPTFAGNKTSGQDTSQSEFYYAPPTGFKSLNTSNLDDPTVTPSEHFDVLTYNGAYDNYMNYSGTSPQTVTGTDFTPEIVWIKDRDNVSSSYGNGYHGGYWFDNVMGTGYALNTDLDNSSHSGSSLASGEDGISSFNSNGFSVDEAEETNYMADTDYSSTPDTAERYVAWCWKLGSSGSSSTWASGNTNPDTEKYNASAGVSIINHDDSAYSGSAITLNHSLGAAPEFAIAFDYAGYTSGHYVWHKDLSSGNYLTLDSYSGQTSDTDYFPASPATATTFTLGTSISSGTQSHVALFTGVEGYSKFGSYTGNGSSDGPMVFTGFRPAWLLVKKLNAAESWILHDTARSPFNVSSNKLSPNSSIDENNLTFCDFLSNGFKLKTSTSGEGNDSSSSYIYAAFAESPFKHANAR